MPRRFLEHGGGTIVIPPIGMQDRLWLCRGEALILVLLLSVGLWGAVALLAGGGRW